MREFAGIDLGRERAPDETTVCKFRHLLEAHGLCGKILRASTPTCRGTGVKSAGHDCGCDHHPCAEFDQEPVVEPRPGKRIRRAKAISGTSE